MAPAQLQRVCHGLSCIHVLLGQCYTRNLLYSHMDEKRAEREDTVDHHSAQGTLGGRGEGGSLNNYHHHFEEKKERKKGGGGGGGF